MYSVLPCATFEKRFDGPKGNSNPFLQTTTRFEYDNKDCLPTQTSIPFGNVTSTTTVTGDSYVSETARQYDNHGDTWLISMPTQITATQTTPSGESTTRTTSYTYDTTTGELANEIREPSGDGSIKLTRGLSRDNTGLITSVTEASAGQQRTTQVAYDTIDHVFPAAVTNALLQVEQFAYHTSFSALVAFQDQNNNLTRWQIDGFGRPRTQLPPDAANVTISYNSKSATGNTYKISVRRAGGQEIESIIDELGREIFHFTRGFDGRQIITDKLYDGAGRLAQVTNPFFENEVPAGSTLFVYDPLGRLRTITHPDGSVFEQTYSGLTTTVFDENRNKKIIDMDQLRRPVKVSEQVDAARLIETHYAYGPFGVLESATDPAGNVTRSQFDVRGRRTLLSDPDSGTDTTVWNAFDEMVGGTDALGNQFQYIRDVLGRPFQINSREGTTAITWDGAPHGIGNIQQATSPEGMTSLFGYDSLSRLTTEETQADRRSFVYNYTYDSLGRLATIRYPSVDVSSSPPFGVCFNYTPYGAIRAVNDVTSGSPVQIWQDTARNAFDEVTAEAFANGAATTRQFDLRGRLTSLSTIFKRLYRTRPAAPNLLAL